MWLCKGWYGVARPPLSAEAWEQVQSEHREAARLESARRPGHVLSHTTAALLHGLAVSLAPGTPVDLTARSVVPSARREEGVVVHHSRTLELGSVDIDGLPVTTLDRTVADFIRMRSLPHGLALLDDALRRGLTDIESVTAVLDNQVRWRGRPRAKGVLALADPVRESWSESFSFGHLHLQGVPLPLHQATVLDEDGNFLGRVDGLWPESGVVGESDGETKYLMEPVRGQTLEESVRLRLESEAVRQAGMEELGLAFVRWTPAQIRQDPEKVAGRVKAARRNGRPHLFRGWVVWDGERRRLPFSVSTPSTDLERLRQRRRPHRRAA